MFLLENLLRDNTDSILKRQIVFFSHHEQILLFSMSFLPSNFTFNELMNKSKSYFPNITMQSITKNLRMLKSREIVSEVGYNKKDKRVKAYGLTLKGIAFALILTEMVAIKDGAFNSSDLISRKIIRIGNDETKR